LADDNYSSSASDGNDEELSAGDESISPNGDESDVLDDASASGSDSEGVEPDDLTGRPWSLGATSRISNGLAVLVEGESRGEVLEFDYHEDDGVCYFLTPAGWLAVSVADMVRNVDRVPVSVSVACMARNVDRASGERPDDAEDVGDVSWQLVRVATFNDGALARAGEGDETMNANWSEECCFFLYVEGEVGGEKVSTVASDGVDYAVCRLTSGRAVRLPLAKHSPSGACTFSEESLLCKSAGETGAYVAAQLRPQTPYTVTTDFFDGVPRTASVEDVAFDIKLQLEDESSSLKKESKKVWRRVVACMKTATGAAVGSRPFLRVLEECEAMGNTPSHEDLAFLDGIAFPLTFSRPARRVPGQPSAAIAAAAELASAYPQRGKRVRVEDDDCEAERIVCKEVFGMQEDAAAKFRLYPRHGVLVAGQRVVFFRLFGLCWEAEPGTWHPVADGRVALYDPRTPGAWTTEMEPGGGGSEDSNESSSADEPFFASGWSRTEDGAAFGLTKEQRKEWFVDKGLRAWRRFMVSRLAACMNGSQQGLSKEGLLGEWCDVVATLFKGTVSVSGKDVYLWSGNWWTACAADERMRTSVVATVPALVRLVRKDITDEYSRMPGKERAGLPARLPDAPGRQHSFASLVGVQSAAREDAGAWSSYTGTLAALEECMQPIVQRAAARLVQHSKLWTPRSVEWNSHRHILPVKNGVIEFSRDREPHFEFRRGQPGDLCTVHVNVPFDEECTVEGSRWAEFVSQVTAGDEAAARFLQEYCGSALARSLIGERALLVIVGGGANGKSVLCDVLGAVMRPLIGDVQEKVLLEAGKDSSGSGPTPHLHTLHGMALATCTESPNGAAFDPVLFKKIGSGDAIWTRAVRGQPKKMEHPPRMLLGTNHAPALVDCDQASRDRYVLMRFPCRFYDAAKAGNKEEAEREAGPDFARPADNQLKHYITGHEAPVVLRWLVDGCARWLANGGLGSRDFGPLTRAELSRPPLSKGDAELAAVREFADAHVEAQEGAKIAACELQAAYEQWAKGRKPIGPSWKKASNLFSKNLGYEKVSESNSRWYAGARLKNGANGE
jgi:phage/plasmid-associated DNA primase